MQEVWVRHNRMVVYSEPAMYLSVLVLLVASVMARSQALFIVTLAVLPLPLYARGAASVYSWWTGTNGCLRRVDVHFERFDRAIRTAIGERGIPPGPGPVDVDDHPVRVHRIGFDRVERRLSVLELDGSVYVHFQAPDYEPGDIVAELRGIVDTAVGACLPDDR